MPQAGVQGKEGGMRTVSSSRSPKNVRAPGRSGGSGGEGGGDGGEGGGDGGELKLT